MTPPHRSTTVPEQAAAAEPTVDLAKLARARKLFGWPVRLLDQLGELRENAFEGTIDIDEWRTRAAALTIDAPAPPAAEDLKPTRRAAVRAWLIDTDDAPPEIERLAERLSAFGEPPTDADLWEELAALRAEARRPARDGNSDPDIIYKRTQRTVALLTRNHTTHDEDSGLPWALLGEHRWVQINGVGWVPAPLGVARSRAQAAVEDLPKDDPVRVQARLLAGQVDSTRVNMGAAMADLNHHLLYGLAKEVLTETGSSDPATAQLVDDFTALWASPTMVDLLLRRTALGWPDQLQIVPRPTEPQ